MSPDRRGNPLRLLQSRRQGDPPIAPAPACTDSDHFYYKEKKLSFTKQEDVYKRSLQATKKGKTLTFHWRGGYLTKEVLRELLDLIEKAGKERQKTALIKLNWPQAVLRVRYTDEASRLSPWRKQMKGKKPRKAQRLYSSLCFSAEHFCVIGRSFL